MFFSVIPKEMDRRQLTLGLCKVGHSDVSIDKLYTFRKGDSKYINLVMDNTPSHDQIQDLTTKLGKYGSVSLMGQDLENIMSVFDSAMNKEPDTKLRIWYDRATYN